MENNNSKPTDDSIKNASTTTPLKTTNQMSKFKKIVGHRIRHRTGKAEVKFQTIRSGLELLDPSWEKMDTTLTEGKIQLIEYLRELKKLHKRRFNNLIITFEDLVPILQDLQ